MTINKNQKNKDKIAPGMNDAEELNQSASKKDVQDGDSTKVVTLSLDEVEPS